MVIDEYDLIRKEIKKIYPDLNVFDDVIPENQYEGIAIRKLASEKDINVCGVIEKTYSLLCRTQILNAEDRLMYFNLYNELKQSCILKPYDLNSLYKDENGCMLYEFAVKIYL